MLRLAVSPMELCSTIRQQRMYRKYHQCRKNPLITDYWLPNVAMSVVSHIPIYTHVDLWKRQRNETLNSQPPK